MNLFKRSFGAFMKGKKTLVVLFVCYLVLGRDGFPLKRILAVFRVKALERQRALMTTDTSLVLQEIVPEILPKK